MEYAVWTHHMLHNSLNNGGSVIAATTAVGEVCKISGPKCGRGAARIKGQCRRNRGMWILLALATWEREKIDGM